MQYQIDELLIDETSQFAYQVGEFVVGESVDSGSTGGVSGLSGISGVVVGTLADWD